MVPIDRNGLITMYEVQYEPLETFGGQIQTQTMNVTALDTDLRGLEEFVNYTINVRAYTIVGEGPYSMQMTAMTPPDGKNLRIPVYHCHSFFLVPSLPPQNVQLQVMSATEISVRWMEVPPLHENGIVEIYEVLYQPLQSYDRTQQHINTSNLSILLENLHEFANYSIQVRTYTNVGPGSYSDQQIIQTNETGNDYTCIHFIHLTFNISSSGFSTSWYHSYSPISNINSSSMA